MPAYNEVLTQVKSLTVTEQLRLLNDLKGMVEQGIKVDDDEIISIEDINESEVALQDYLAGRDSGKSLEDIEIELFGYLGLDINDKLI
ncbi:hypothetical protein [Planktothrix agardhii]|uniref:Uncharacterized protein n=3 Tax=Planktothrix agardhii TaxID=1160 RepID=A0AAD1Q239_PLAAG|nr:hypothetical protein [Planktothrix agardhii]MCF3587919.1 hypothetical protein [Planktothrix agardhii 1029]MCF3622803.1 hypothetical protein [Planktothrix agardhii 1030]MCP9296954.1 hypothetical protein [Planktothrix agardhii LY1]MEA5563420.1 hypothetical protein [Planktothrix agardhii UHCC 0887]CAD5925383.1 hypothetical protein PANO66_00968 [Planktothrix agardhii]